MKVQLCGVATAKGMKHLRKLSADIIVFDWYAHQPRTQLIEKDLEYSLKQWKLSYKKGGFNVMQYPMDADTAIIKTTLTAAKDSPVNVFADGNDILSLLIHQMTNSSTDMYNINKINVKKEQRRECYNVTDILNALENHLIKYLFFAHAFTGCDTTSAIHNFGKIPYSRNSKILLL